MYKPSRKSTFLPFHYIVKSVFKDESSPESSHGRVCLSKKTSFQEIENDMTKCPVQYESRGRNCTKTCSWNSNCGGASTLDSPQATSLTPSAPNTRSTARFSTWPRISRTLIPVLILIRILRNTVLLAPRTKYLMVLQARRRALDTYSPDRQRFVEEHNQKKVKLTRLGGPWESETSQ